MAMMITGDCINCGNCEPECPNQAIRLGPEIYVIDPARCAECVGVHESPHCAAICPTAACVPNPARVESRVTLVEKRKWLQRLG